MNPNDNNNNQVNRDNISYKPFTESKDLSDLLKESKGIESLWKKIKDNKDGKKSGLYKSENDLLELTKKFLEAFSSITQLDKTIDLGKNARSKEEYRLMVTKFLNGPGETDAFIKKFPHWTIQVGKLFTDSWHFKRISTGVSGAKEKTENITDSSIFDVQKKGGEKKTGRESKSEKTNKGILKQINLFWNRYFKRGGLGQASKSKVTIELKKFGDYVNKPWRKWWEVICPSDEKLSNSKPKSLLKEALGKSTEDARKTAVINLFNMGTPADSVEKKTKKHNQHISGFDDLSNFNQDNFKDQFHAMYTVFSSLDKSLGNKVRELFGVGAIKEKSFFDKFKKKSSEQKPANAIEMQNLNQQQQNQPANGGGNVQQPGAKQNNKGFVTISDIVKKLPQDGKGGKAEVLIEIANSVIPEIKYDQDFKLDRVDGYLIPIAKFIGLPEENCNRKYIEDNLCKKLKKDPTEQELLINKIRNIIVECWNDKDYGFGELGRHIATGDHLPPIPKKRQKNK